MIHRWLIHNCANCCENIAGFAKLVGSVLPSPFEACREHETHDEYNKDDDFDCKIRVILCAL